MITSIIIPTFNGLALLREAIQSIQLNTPEPYELIVVDNGSTDGTLDYLREQRIVFISLPNNAGFPVACNWGLKLARGDSLLLLNNDVLVTERWLGKLNKALHKAPTTGIVGPMSNYVNGRQQMDMEGTYMEAASRLETEAFGQLQQVNRVIGFCMLFKRELMLRIGLLDERFSPGHFEDDDYCYRARQAGYSIFIARDTFVFHHGSASFVRENKEAVNRLIDRNRRLFIDKWGTDPHQFI